MQPLASQTVCQNSLVTALTVTVANGTGIPSYQWYSNSTNAFTGISIPLEQSATFQPSSAILGTTYYYCIIQYANGGCGSLTTIISDVRINPIATIPNKTAPICSGATFNVIPSGSVFPEIVPAGTLYTWTVTIPNAFITGASNMSLQPSISQTLNNNGLIPYNVVYQVTPFTGICQGTPFTVTITVSPKVRPNAVINNIICNSNPPICNGSISLFPSGSGPFTYQWSIPGTTSVQTNLCAGNYWVDVSDAFGCTYRFIYTITVPPPMVSIPSVYPVNNTNCDFPISCNGIIQVEVSGGTPFASATNPYNFQWYQVPIIGSPVPILTSLTQVNRSILQNLCGGTYLLVVTDGVNCQRQFGPYTITNPIPLVVTSTVSSYNGYGVSCNGGSNGTIGINVTGGSGTINLILNQLNPLGPPPVTRPNPATFSGLTAGTYTVVIRDLLNICPDITRTFVLTQPLAPLSATLNVLTPALCFGNQAVYEAIASGGVGSYTYLWSNGIATQIVNNIPLGPFTCIVTDSNGCQFTLRGNNTTPSLLVATAAVTTPILCFGGNAVVTVTVNGGTPAYSIAGNGLPANLIASSPISYTIGNVPVSSPTFTITDANGCRSTTSITVTQPGPLAFTIRSTTNPNCLPNRLYNNGSICITITGGTTAFPVGSGWVRSTNTLTPNDWCLSGLSAGTYPIAIRDLNNCPSTSQIVTLTRPTPLTAFVTSNVNVDCPTKNVSQTNIAFAAGGVPGYFYNWSGGSTCPGPPNPQCMTTDVNGNYTVSVNDQEGVSLGCIAIQVPVLVNLPMIGNPLMSIASSAQTICGIYAINDPITLTNSSTGDYTSIEWFIDGISFAGANSLTHNFTTVGNHTVTLVVNYKIGGVTCTYSITEIIPVTRGYDMVVPNGFTPANYDGINDTIKPEFNCMEGVEMRVYDTWGSLLYVESGPTLTGWNGTINGHESENGNYIIVVRAKTLFGAIIDYNGPFTLLK